MRGLLFVIVAGILSATPVGGNNFNLGEWWQNEFDVFDKINDKIEESNKTEPPTSQPTLKPTKSPTFSPTEVSGVDQFYICSLYHVSFLVDVFMLFFKESIISTFILPYGVNSTKQRPIIISIIPAIFASHPISDTYHAA